MKTQLSEICHTDEKYVLQIMWYCRLSDKHLCRLKRSNKEFREVLFCCLETALEEDIILYGCPRDHETFRLEDIKAISC